MPHPSGLKMISTLLLSATVLESQVQSRVEAVMQELGIRHLRDRVISTGGGAPGGAGDASFSVSGGERQRVSIAMELVTSPPGKQQRAVTGFPAHVHLSGLGR